MADNIGVTPTHNTHPGTAHGRPTIGQWVKKHKTLAVLGGAGGVFLVASHKGSQANANTATQDQLQNQANGVANGVAGLESGSLLPPGGGAPVDTGGGSYTAQGPSATTAPTISSPLAPVAITINPPASATAATATPAGKTAVKAKPKPKGRTGKGRTKPSNKAKPRGPHKTQPAPHNNRPPKRPNTGTHGAAHHNNNSGGHKNTRKTTPAGHRKKSPVEVESMMNPGGAGSGVMIHGRQFPGAIAHRFGTVRVTPTGVNQEVMIYYGGRTEKCISHDNGRIWTDNVPGAGPPSRGTSMYVEPGRVA